MHRNILVSLLLLSSCGFKAASRDNAVPLQIPFVKGDSDGTLTANIIDEVEKQGLYEYVSSGGRYQLSVQVLDSKNKTIGYRFDEKQLRMKHKKLVCNESRARILVEVSIIDTNTQKVLLGPAHLTAFADYDHENYKIDHNELRFSLGQLVDVDTAYDTVHIPLYRAIAKEIARYIQDHAELIHE